MRVLLDECIPRKLKNALPDHDCQTVPEAGLAGNNNGLLLSLAERAGFDIFFTIDKGLQYQQNLVSWPQDCDSHRPRQIKSSRGFVTALSGVPIDHEFDSAGSGDTRWRLEANWHECPRHVPAHAITGFDGPP
jgi:hypothetical protein